MEKGEMRVEANISVSTDPKILGVKVEVKNLNSFRSVERAIKYELDRMTELLENGKGEEIVQETRGWDEGKQKTFSQRKKESSQDYRYFPDPDLPKMKLHEAFDLEKMKKDLPELPAEKRVRYKKDFGIKDEDIESYINNPILGVWFENVANILKSEELVRLASNYITNDMIGFFETVLVKNTTKYPSPENFTKLILMNFNKKINSAVTKKLLGNLVTFDEDPEKVAQEEGLLQQNDEKDLKEIAQKIIDANPKIVADYKGGKENALMSFVGQIMKETKGSANPVVVKKLLLELLK
jgi:aspartyl-tRNA(Asn)/glutamyl-tRNA(Gln) amidotransferase subunit B